MSEPPERVRQEEDRISGARVLAVGLVALSAFAIGIWWAGSEEWAASGSLRNVTAPAQMIGRDEIGMVYQTPFGEPIAVQRERKNRQRLREVGWVDRERRILHIPIDRAMQLTVQKGWRP